MVAPGRIVAEWTLDRDVLGGKESRGVIVLTTFLQNLPESDDPRRDAFGTRRD